MIGLDSRASASAVKGSTVLAREILPSAYLICIDRNNIALNLLAVAD